jgi:site-specific recombinase XerD
MGKGRKSRFVYLSNKGRKALRAYLKMRHDANPFVFVTEGRERLSYWGLKEMVKRRAKKARVPVPQIHAFRRWFALNALRNGMDIYRLAVLMGHSPKSIQILIKYLKFTESDLRASHDRFSSVDDLQ